MDEEFGLDSDDPSGRDDESVFDRIRGNITEITSLLVTATWLLLLFFGPGDLWLGVLLVGYVVILPLVKILAGEDDKEEFETDTQPGEAYASEDLSQSDQDALESLRMRYAKGELTDEQFEQKVEKLLETETVTDAKEQFSEREYTTRERETE